MSGPSDPHLARFAIGPSVACAFLAALPPELRLRVFEFALQYEGPLRKSEVGDGTRRSRNDRLMLAGVLGVSRQVYGEAIDIFYRLNDFQVPYLSICRCTYGEDDAAPRDGWRVTMARGRIQPFDEQRIRSLHITSFDPGADTEHDCTTCAQAGLGLISYLAGLPKLRVARVDFDFVFGFTLFADRLRRECATARMEWQLLGAEVGDLLLTGTGLDIRLSLLPMNLVWRRLAGQPEQPAGRQRLMGEESIEHALEYLQFEADAWGRVPKALAPFFALPEHGVAAELVLKSHSAATHRLAAFTESLAEVLSDIFMDIGGAESMDWTSLYGPAEWSRWRLSEGCMT